MNHTADICDAIDKDAKVVQPIFRSYGGKVVFEGEISTIKCFEDNSLVRDAVAEPGNNRVLVIDGRASMRCALLGDLLAEKAVQNGWQGVIVNGCIRDSAAISGMDLGVRALATHPRKTVKLGAGQRDVAVEFGGQVFMPGTYLYADADGIVLTDKPVDSR
ncbi:MAG: ribonuclease E activity regulator RraA [Gammaproteobacteria bacterium]|nr:ribonuclease E activity regulator RraA [Gammaproteobacteria bacterium]